MRKSKVSYIGPQILNTLLPVALAFFIGGIIILCIGENPIEAYSMMLGKSLFTTRGFLNTLHYVETFNRNLLLHTEQEKIICYRSMKDLEQELAPHGFVRCHTSYIVNLYYVKGVNKLEITLVTGETIPVSQPKRRQFMEQLAEYWGDFL